VRNRTSRRCSEAAALVSVPEHRSFDRQGKDGMETNSRIFERREVVIDERPLFPRIGRASRRRAQRRAEVVLVHGLGLSGRYMLPVAACLAARYRVLLPDLPGFGDSGHRARVLDGPALADALAAWMRAMSLRRAALIA
jgi:pimeloyl-ACP methyl ester carboxylesterase